MANKNGTKKQNKKQNKQTIVYKTVHRKLKIEQLKNRGWTQMLQKVKQFLLH